MRSNGRKNDEMRPVHFERQYTKYAEGSVLARFGDTRVLCNVSVIKGVPRFLKDSGQGWLTAEYAMLPRATHTRGDREAARGKQSGRTQEIQRLIGRALRAAVDLERLPEVTLRVDCDVLQADGGTRTAAITGANLALADAIEYMRQQQLISPDCQALKNRVAAISVGVVDGVPVLDLDYEEDAAAETDMNVVMTDQAGIVEVQGTAEGEPFSEQQFQQMMALARKGIGELVACH